jgi:hypothetical protein
MLSDEEFLKLLGDVVNERGVDYVDPRAEVNAACVYIENGTPMCLAGVLLSRLGMSNDDLQSMDGYGNIMEVSMSSTYLDGLLTDNQLYALTAAQLAQDCGLSWGLAYMDAEKAMSESAGATK